MSTARQTKKKKKTKAGELFHVKVEESKDISGNHTHKHANSKDYYGCTEDM